jgi:hypothetical protein
MKKINWYLISNIAVILSMITVLIGFTFLATQLKNYKNRIEALELQYKMIEQDIEDNYEIDQGIKVVNNE